MLKVLKMSNMPKMSKMFNFLDDRYEHKKHHYIWYWPASGHTSYRDCRADRPCKWPKSRWISHNTTLGGVVDGYNNYFGNCRFFKKFHQKYNEDTWFFLASIIYLIIPIGSFFSGFITGKVHVHEIRKKNLKKVPLWWMWKFVCSQTDPLGRKRSMILMNIPFVIGWFLLYRATKVWEIFVGFVFLGLANGLGKNSRFFEEFTICVSFRLFEVEAPILSFANLNTKSQTYFVFLVSVESPIISFVGEIR